MRTIECDVFIVGAGPTGLTAAALLARDGVRVSAITRYPGLANSPRAHIINQRTMEIFRDLGIEERISGHAMPASFMGQVIWAENLAGREIARRRGWGAGEDRRSEYAAASPCVPTNIPQHVLEPILCEVATELGADIVFNRELISMTQDSDRVRSICRDRSTGEEIEVLSRYAVGADGDNSAVCREIGFDVQGMAGLGHMINYWITADLAPYTAHRPGALYQVIRPGGDFAVDNAMFVNVEPWDQWVMSVPYDPTEGPADVSAGTATALARKYVGDDDLSVSLISASTWTVNQMHAEVMHKGRVVIAGNAAHRHPPAGGLGANTCVQDAFNLSWKLGLLLRGAAGAAILESYSAERAPVARQIVERANSSFAALMAIPDALELVPGQTLREGEEALNARFQDSPRGAQQRRRLAEALRMQDKNFNALGAELGQFYESSAVVPDGERLRPIESDGLHYVASTTPGSTVPHVWLTRGKSALSTHDVVGKGRFTLLTGIGGYAWRSAVEAVAADLGVGVDVVAIGPGAEIEDPYLSWAEIREIDESGCLLVRPDRHIAYRCASLPDDPTAHLREALGAVLDLELVS